MTVERIDVDTTRRKVADGQALLVCACPDEERARELLVDGAITLAELKARRGDLSPDQELVFYCNPAGETARRAARRWRRKGFEAARVLEGGWAAWRAAGGADRAASPQEARDVMTSPPAFVSAEANVLEAARAMRDQAVGCLPVRDCEGRYVGMITDRDIAVRVTAEDKDPRRTRVREVMSRDLVVCEEGTDLAAVARVMQDHRVRRVPIVRSGAAADGDGPTEIVGIVSLEDLRTDLPAPASGPRPRDVEELPVEVDADGRAVD